MRMSILSWLIVMISFGVAAASPLRDQLRLQINAGDHAAAKQTVADADAQFRAGKISADDLRDVFIHLSRSHPKTVAFVQNWATEEPQNPHALIARSWSLYGASQNVRLGENSYSARIADEMWYEGAELATRAYQLDPKLIPASDAMVRKFGGTGRPEDHPLAVLETVMKDQPNFGTLLRAMPRFAGGSAEKMTKICNHLTRNLGDPQKMAHQCLMMLAGTFEVDSLREYAHGHLWENSDPELDIERIGIFLNDIETGQATREQASQIRKLFLSAQLDQFELLYGQNLAIKFDNYYLSKDPKLPLDADFRRAHLERATSYLDDDPYNLKLIDFVDGVSFLNDYETSITIDGHVHSRVVRSEMSPEQRAALLKAKNAEALRFAKQRLRASPYSPELWYELSSRLRRGGAPGDAFKGDKSLQNAIAFSDNPIPYVETMMYTKFQIFDLRRQLNNKKDDLPPEWQKFQDELDPATDILCPFLRAHRYREATCRHFDNKLGGCVAEQVGREEAYDIMHSIALEAPECRHLLKAEISEFAYTPIPYEEAVPE